jgi:hypothetical protein
MSLVNLADAHGAVVLSSVNQVSGRRIEEVRRWCERITQSDFAQNAVVDATWLRASAAA